MAPLIAYTDATRRRLHPPLTALRIPAMPTLDAVLPNGATRRAPGDGRAFAAVLPWRATPQDRRTVAPSPAADPPPPRGGDVAREHGDRELAALLDFTERGSRLHAALATPSVQVRWLLALAYAGDRTRAEIASSTRLALNTVKSAILRAQHKLRDLRAPPAR